MEPEHIQEALDSYHKEITASPNARFLRLQERYKQGQMSK